MQQENADAGAEKEATKKVEEALEEGFAEVHTPSDASKTLDKVEATGAGLEEKDIPAEAGSPDPLEQAETIKAAVDSATSKDRPAAALATAAVQVASAHVDQRTPLDEGIRQAGGPAAAEESPEAKKGRDLLRRPSDSGDQSAMDGRCLVGTRRPRKLVNKHDMPGHRGEHLVAK